MIPDAPDDLGAGPAVHGSQAASHRRDAAWRTFAKAVITESHLLANAAIDDAAAATRVRVDRAFADWEAHMPSAAVAVTLGATIGIVAAALLTPRILHDRG
jgi:hypothetical protein